MKTLIELYDERPLENVLSTEVFSPERTVFICPPEVGRDTRLQQKLREYFAHRGVQAELEFVTASLLDMQRFYQGFYPTFDAALFDRLGEIFPLDPRRPMRHLSKGMQKQAAFWLALSLRPRILLLDEPVDGLDPVMRRRLWSLLMNQVEQRELTVLISSHNLRELEDVCDHVGVISGGELLLERSLSQLQEDFVKLQIVFRPQGPCTLPGLPILHESVAGRIHTLILRCGEEQAVRAAQALDPVFYDVLPLTLEEIFIYELGGADDGLKDLVL